MPRLQKSFSRDALMTRWQTSRFLDAISPPSVQPCAVKNKELIVFRLHTRTNTRTDARTNAHACTDTGTHGRRHAWTQARMDTRMDARTHARTHARSYARSHARTHACTYRHARRQKPSEYTRRHTLNTKRTRTRRNTVSIISQHSSKFC